MGWMVAGFKAATVAAGVLLAGAADAAQFQIDFSFDLINNGVYANQVIAGSLVYDVDPAIPVVGTSLPLTVVNFSISGLSAPGVTDPWTSANVTGVFGTTIDSVYRIAIAGAAGNAGREFQLSFAATSPNDLSEGTMNGLVYTVYGCTGPSVLVRSGPFYGNSECLPGIGSGLGGTFSVAAVSSTGTVGAVPLPPAGAMLLAGLGGLGLWRWRKV